MRKLLSILPLVSLPVLLMVTGVVQEDLRLDRCLPSKQNRFSLMVCVSNKQLIQDGLQLLRGFDLCGLLLCQRH